MTLYIYADGSGHPKSGFGWFVKEMNKSHYVRLDDHITNNQAEYMAIISALQYVVSDLSNSTFSDDNDNDDNNDDHNHIIIYSDSLNTVKQLNHDYAINNAALRELAMQAWSEMAKLDKKCKLEIAWIRRKDNLAGKMLGS